MKKLSLLFAATLIYVLGLQSCGHHHHDHDHFHAHPTLYATLYQQQAAEYVALCYQAFNLASMHLHKELTAGHELPLAVVVDIDETVLDNSPYQATAILEGFGYPKRWAEWVELANAEPVPGALEFLLEAEVNGVEVFYVTNRREEYRDATLRNLQSKGFPFADDDHLMMRTVTNDKEPRRRMITEAYHIAVLVGDNLGDFHSDFDSEDAGHRMQQTEAYRAALGSNWIMLPNAIYGTWINALPGYKHGIVPDELAFELQQGLNGF
jgi:5'-nucleotidase (lipoprotein e(P4) family)